MQAEYVAMTEQMNLYHIGYLQTVFVLGMIWLDLLNKDRWMTGRESFSKYIPISIDMKQVMA